MSGTVNFLPLKKAIPIIAKTINERVRDDYDAVMAITGGEGVGKSTFGIQLGKAIDTNFTLEKNILFYAENMIDQMRGNPRYSYNMVDEAARALYSRTWYEKRQILINKYLRVCRKENKILALIIPNFWDLDSGIRNKRVLIWIWILERNSRTGIGKAAMFINDFNQFYSDPWGLKEGQRLFSRLRGMDYLMRDDIRYKNIAKIPSFVCFFEFPKLNDKLFAEYRELAEKANEELEKSEDVEDKYRAAFMELCYSLNMDEKVPVMLLQE